MFDALRRRTAGLAGFSLLALVAAVFLGCAGPRANGILTSGPFEGRHPLAICYGPHRDGQRPGVNAPSASEIREDLSILAERWNLLRVYGASEFAETMLETIREEGLDLRVVLGAWIDVEERRDDAGRVTERHPEVAEANRREVEAAIRLANAYPDLVVAVSVGNETQVYWSWHKSPLEVLLRYVRQVKRSVTVPVTVADDYNYWNKPESRQLVAEIDFVTLHIHPLWNGKQLEESLPWVKSQLAIVREIHPDALVITGETGWATRVHNEGEQAKLIKGSAGSAEQAVFYEAVTEWVDEEREVVFFFEAFDEKWKGSDHPNEVEKHWGLFRSDRTPKKVFSP